MISKEVEPAIFLDVPWISVKTSHRQVKGFSDLRWSSSDSINHVTDDIFNNATELLAGSNIDWELVLSSIRTEKLGIVRIGKAAIAANGARFIGGLAARAGWAMHDPQIVYLSGKYLAHIAGANLEDFKTTMTKRAVSYGRKTLPEAELLMKTLDLLLEHPSKRNHSNLVGRIANLLHDGNIQGAYNIVSHFEDLESRREPVSSKTTTSSILTPPNPGI